MAKSTRRRVKRSRKVRRQRGGALTLLKFTMGVNSTPTLVGAPPAGFANFVGGPGGSLNFNTPAGSTINNISFMGGADGSTPIVNTKVFAPQTPTGIGMSIGAVSKLVPRGLMVRGGTALSGTASGNVKLTNLNNANLNLGTGTSFSIQVDLTPGATATAPTAPTASLPSS